MCEKTKTNEEVKADERRKLTAIEAVKSIFTVPSLNWRSGPERIEPALISGLTEVCKVLILSGMTLELESEVSKRTYRMSPKAFGKLLHMARLQGWRPERVSNEWPSDSWKTEIILPHLGPYMPGRVSRADALGLKKALTCALATGCVAVEGTVHYAAATLLHVAREGAFWVRFIRSESPDAKPRFETASA